MSGDKDMTTEQFLIFILPMILLVGAATVGTVFAYDFVYCYDGPTNATMIYPEGTSCELTDDNLEEDLEKEDEKEHEEWAKDNE